jgi:sugar lactone lactonase YvrE
MKNRYVIRWAILCTLLALLAIRGVAQQSRHALTEVYKNPDFQLTGITASTGRLFVNFPRWSAEYLNAVVEVKPDGTVTPYPDEYWNRWDMKVANAGTQFVCVQSVVADDSGNLWVLDPAAPMLITPVPGGAKLVKIDLSTNKVTNVVHFGPDIAKDGSYLNDVRVDTHRNFAYITESGTGGIVVVDLATGKAHRALDGNRSVLAEPDAVIKPDGKPVVAPNGKPFAGNSDGIALSLDGNYLYYQALAGATLYRIRTDILRDPNARPDAVTAAVEKVAKTFPVDGLWMSSKGTLYLSNLNANAVSRLLPSGATEIVASDSRLQWPDTFSEGPDGAIYISASHINESPTFNHGKSVRKLPYGVFKFTP